MRNRRVVIPSTPVYHCVTQSLTAACTQDPGLPKRFGEHLVLGIRTASRQVVVSGVKPRLALLVLAFFQCFPVWEIW